MNRRAPTGFSELNQEVVGGFPCGQLSVIYGGPSTGKSLLLYASIAHFQACDPRHAVLFDLSADYDSDWGERHGVVEDRLLVLRPGHAEQVTEMLTELLEQVADVGLVAMDSLAHLVSEEEVSKSCEEEVELGTGLCILDFVRSAVTALRSARGQGPRPAVVCTNHARGFGDTTGMVGGKMMEYFAGTVVRLDECQEVVEPGTPAGPCAVQLRGVVEKRAGEVCTIKFEGEVALAGRGVDAAEARA